MRKIVIQHLFQVLMLSAVLIHGASAQSEGYRKTVDPNDPFKVHIYNYVNGLTLMVRTNPALPRIQAMIGFRAGSRYEPEGATGLAHVVEHLLMKGTDSIGALDYEHEKEILEHCSELHELIRKSDGGDLRALYSELDSLYAVASQLAVPGEYHMMMYALGAKRVDGGTTPDRTYFEVDIPSHSLKTWLRIERERFRYPVFRLVSSEMEAVFEEYNLAVNHEGMRINQAIFSALFPSHPYRKPYYGEAQHLQKLSIKQARAFFQDRYQPNNMCIVLVGDVNPDSAARLVDLYFSSLQGSTTSEQEIPFERITAPKFVTIDGSATEGIVVAFALPPGETSKAEMMSQFANTTFRNAASAQNKISSAYSYVMRFRDCTIHVLVADLLGSVDSIDDIKKALLRPIHDAKAGKIGEKDMQIYTTSLKAMRSRQHADNWRSALTLVQAFSMKGWTSEVNDLKDLPEIRPSQIATYANDNYLTNYVVIHKRQRSAAPADVIEGSQRKPLPIDFSKRSSFFKQVIGTTDTLLCEDTRPLFGVKDDDNLIVSESHSGNFKIDFLVKVGFCHFPLLRVISDYLNRFSTESYAVTRAGGSARLEVRSHESILTASGPNHNFPFIVTSLVKWVRDASLADSVLDMMIQEEMTRWNRLRNSRNGVLTAVDDYLIYGPENPTTAMSPKRLATLRADSLVGVFRSLFTYQPAVRYEGISDRDSVERILNRLQLCNGPRGAFPPERFGANKRTAQRYFVNLDEDVIDVRWSVPAKDVATVELPTLQLFNSYFGVSYPGSLLYNELRVRQGLARFLSGSYDLLKDQKVVKIAVTTSAGKTRSVLEAVNRILATFPRHDLAFDIQRRNLLSQYEAGERAPFGRVDHHIDFCESLSSMRFTDLEMFYRSHVEYSDASICVIGQKARLDESILGKGWVELNVNQLFGDD